MAHRGLRWRLAFRRDFNLNVTSNNFGWAHRYELHIRSLNPFGGHPLDNTDWVLGPMVESPINVCTWLSELQVHGGRTWQWLFTETIFGNPAKHDRHTQLFSPPGNLAADWQLLDNLSTNNGFFFGSAPLLVYRDPTVFSFDPIQSGNSAPLPYSAE